jgi:hypothetical protein
MKDRSADRIPKALGNRNLSNGVLANHSVGLLFGVAAACASLMELPAERLNHLYSRPVGHDASDIAEMLGGALEVDWRADHVRRTALRVGERRSHLQVLHLRISKHLIDGVDRSARNAGALQLLHPVCCAALSRELCDRGIDADAFAQSVRANSGFDAAQ